MRRLARPLLSLGILGIVLALAKYHAAAIGDYDLTGSSRWTWTGAYVAALGLAAYAAGLPDLPRSPRQAVESAVGAAVLGAGAVSVLQLVVGDALLPRFVVFGSAVALVPWSLLCTALATRFRSSAVERDRVVVVAAEADRDELARELDANPEQPGQIVAWLRPHEASSTGPSDRPLLQAVVGERATVVVLDRDAQADESIVSQAAALHEHGVRVRTLSLFYEQWLAKLPVGELERVSLMFDIGEVHRLRYSRLSRVLDVTLALLGLGPLVLVTVVVAVGDLIANRGPLLYRQERVGRGGSVFEMVKFRTMRPDGGRVVDEWTSENDPRITPFGGLLRRTHLDELPQVLNILTGHLSIVGPRPEQPHYVRELGEKLPFYDLRHLVRPGLTGWAQVKYGYAGDEKDALQKLQYEFWYLRHQGLVLDLRIIGRTIRSVLGSEGGGR